VSRSGSPRPRTVFLFSDLLVVAAAEEAWIGDEARYRLVGRYELDEVTVVGNEEVDEEGRRRCGFHVLSRERSFAVYAGASRALTSLRPALPVAEIVVDVKTAQTLSTSATSGSTPSAAQRPPS